MKIRITLTDDDGEIYGGEIELKKGTAQKVTKSEPANLKNSWYKPNSTIEKIITLIEEGFFDKNRTINEIIIQLKSKDYHYKPSDLTLPLRKIVRKGLLVKTKNLPDGTKSKIWTYVRS